MVKKYKTGGMYNESKKNGEYSVCIIYCAYE